MESFLYLALHTAFLFIFSLGLGLGIGASVLSHVMFLFAGKDDRISRDELRLLRASRMVVWISLLLYSFGGLGLFMLAYESMLALGIFYASMMVAAILFVNEFLFSLRHLPRIRSEHDGGVVLDAYLLESGAVSAVSWIFLMFHHVIYRTDIGYFAFMGLYTLALVMAVLITWFVRREATSRDDARILKRSLVAAAVLALVFAGGWFMKADDLFGIQGVAKTVSEKVSDIIDGDTYTLEDVALHATAEDCWLVIDSKVFNATEASRLHPAMFKCGTDVSVNYHKNHGTAIRDKMMKYYIGTVGNGSGVGGADISTGSQSPLLPYRELYVEEGSWSERDLMVVVEKDAENILAIDGTTHMPVGRILNVGFQPHTSVFSSDARYMYIISRDGWLTKIDLTTLTPVMSVSVGKNSRGTAITDNDKYIAIGNYEPGNLVILEADTLQVIKTIPLTEEMGGKTVESRAGAVVEDDNRIIVALKDAMSVWVVDTDQAGFPVSQRFSGIGNDVPALHDAFLTPDSTFYIVASQGSKTAWVLDLKTMKPIAEIETGETPHTGPGASWGKYIYIPALGEGLITVIDTTTWKPAAHIKTGGPGLFVRSYNKNPVYPYVWADTAFGDRKDEIYVIDARKNEIVKTLIPLKGESSWHPEFTYNGKFVYVVSQSGNEIQVYDAYTFEVVKRIAATSPSAISNVGLRIEEPGL